MEQHGLVRRRRLPHWDLPGATYFITTCLEGSIPAEGLLDLARFRASVTKMRRPTGKSQTECEIDTWKRTFARCDDWLDNKPHVRHLAEPRLAAVVAESCYHWAGQRYDLLAYVVMPSHLHLVFGPLAVGQIANLSKSATNPGQIGNLPHDERPRRVRSERERIMHSLKLHTAIECNRLLGQRGKFWQEESYDHCARDDDELERIINYVEQNPVKAGLVAHAEQWPFSSAFDRRQFGILVGQPLLRVGQVANLP
jgi:putative transposase